MSRHTPIPLILDVDTGVDDAMALMLAARHPEADVRAVTCVGGNTALENVVANTLTVLDAIGAGNIPVAAGADRPLLAPPERAGHVHGIDGLAGLARPSSRGVSALSAVELLRQELERAIAAGERVTIVALAPQTNIALLLRTYPHVAPGIERIVFMGGSASGGNATAAAEFNIFHDPEAAAIVLACCREMSIPAMMYGLDVFYQVAVSTDDAARLAGMTDAGAQFAARLITQQCSVFDVDSARIGDAGAVCAVLDPGGIESTRYPVRVSLDAGPARGQTIVDRRTWPGDRDADPGSLPATEIDVALGVDAARYAELWLSIFGR